MKKVLAILGLLTLCIIVTGCGVFDRPVKTSDGLYRAHYTSCGPEALQAAITQFKINNNLYVSKDLHYVTISKQIQLNEKCPSRHILSYIDKTAVEITWPHEIKAICSKYDIKLVEVNIEDVIKKEVYIILANNKKKFFYYHWYAWPGQHLYYFGDNTGIDRVYRLEQIE